MLHDDGGMGCVNIGEPFHEATEPVARRTKVRSGILERMLVVVV